MFGQADNTNGDLVFRISQKLNFKIIVLLYQEIHGLEENYDKYNIAQKKQFDIPLGNLALRAQPTDN